MFICDFGNCYLITTANSFISGLRCLKKTVYIDEDFVKLLKEQIKVDTDVVIFKVQIYFSKYKKMTKTSSTK